MVQAGCRVQTRPNGGDTMPPTPRMEPIPGPDAVARLHAPTGLPRQATKSGTRFVMRLSLIALVLACLWVSGCAAPMKDHAILETHTSHAVAGHGAATDNPPMRSASSGPSIPDGLRSWHRPPSGAERPGGRDVLRSHRPGPAPALPSPPSWAHASGPRAPGWVGNGCDTVSAQHDGYAGWDVLRSLCLFADTDVPPILVEGVPDFHHDDAHGVGFRDRVAGCAELGCPESTRPNGKQGNPWFGPWPCQQGLRERSACRPERGWFQSEPDGTTPAACSPTTQSGAGVGTTTAKRRHRLNDSSPSVPEANTPAACAPTAPSSAGDGTMMVRQLRRADGLSPSVPGNPTPAACGLTAPPSAGDGTTTAKRGLRQEGSLPSVPAVNIPAAYRPKARSCVGVRTGPAG